MTEFEVAAEWTLPELVAWVRFRDFEAVSEAGRGGDEDAVTGMLLLTTGGLMEFPEARDQIVEAGAAGKLTAIVTGSDGRFAIPSRRWKFFDIGFGPPRMFPRNDITKEERAMAGGPWTMPLFPSGVARALWPARTAPPDLSCHALWVTLERALESAENALAGQLPYDVELALRSAFIDGEVRTRYRNSESNVDEEITPLSWYLVPRLTMLEENYQEHLSQWIDVYFQQHNANRGDGPGIANYAQLSRAHTIIAGFHLNKAVYVHSEDLARWAARVLTATGTAPPGNMATDIIADRNGVPPYLAKAPATADTLTIAGAATQLGADSFGRLWQAFWLCKLPFYVEAGPDGAERSLGGTWRDEAGRPVAPFLHLADPAAAIAMFGASIGAETPAAAALVAPGDYLDGDVREMLGAYRIRRSDLHAWVEGQNPSMPVQAPPAAEAQRVLGAAVAAPELVVDGNVDDYGEGRPPEIYSTGAPGRPTSWHLVAAECRRRWAAGERHGHVRAGVQRESSMEWARTLLAWLQQQHPQAPQLTLKTIKNQIAPLLTELKA